MEFRRVLFRSADNLLEQLSVVEQVELAAQLRGADPTGAVALLEAVGLADLAGSALPELSGGEPQRVAFAAAAVGGPALLLADEPTAQLDEAAGASLIETIDRKRTRLNSSHQCSSPMPSFARQKKT